MKRAFLITPFSAERAGSEDPIIFDAVQNAVAEAAALADVELIHPARMNAAGEIIKQVRETIREVDIVLAILAGQNPNVFYEMGIALEKAQRPAILIAPSGKEIPFDVRHNRRITYENIDELDQLVPAISKALLETLALDPASEDNLWDAFQVRYRDAPEQFFPPPLEESSAANFIEPDFVRVRGDSQVLIDSDDPSNALAAGIDGEEVLLIIGERGSGKTTLLKQVFERYLSTTADFLPIIAPLSQLDDEKVILDALNVFHEQVGFHLPGSLEARPAGRAKWLILLDGLDELPGSEQRVKRLRQIQDVVKRYPEPRHHFIVSSRPLIDMRDLHIGDPPVLKILPFDEDRVERYVSNWFESKHGRNKPAATKWTKKTLGKLKATGCGPIMSSPLMLQILTVVASSGDFPPDTTRLSLYRRFVETILLGRKELLATKVLEYCRDGNLPVENPVSFVGSLYELTLPMLSSLAHDRENASDTSLADRAYDYQSETTSLLRSTSLYEKLHRDFLRYYLTLTGIIVSYGSRLDFLHKTVQDYLSALYRVDNELPLDFSACADENAIDSLLFHVALLGQRDVTEAERALTCILDQNERGLFYVVRAIGEGVTVTGSFKDFVIGKVKQYIHDWGPCKSFFSSDPTSPAELLNYLIHDKAFRWDLHMVLKAGSLSDSQRIHTLHQCFAMTDDHRLLYKIAKGTKCPEILAGTIEWLTQVETTNFRLIRLIRSTFSNEELSLCVRLKVALLSRKSELIQDNVYRKQVERAGDAVALLLAVAARIDVSGETEARRARIARALSRAVEEKHDWFHNELRHVRASLVTINFVDEFFSYVSSRTARQVDRENVGAYVALCNQFRDQNCASLLDLMSSLLREDLELALDVELNLARRLTANDRLQNAVTDRLDEWFKARTSRTRDYYGQAKLIGFISQHQRQNYFEAYFKENTIPSVIAICIAKEHLSGPVTRDFFLDMVSSIARDDCEPHPVRLMAFNAWIVAGKTADGLPDLLAYAARRESSINTLECVARCGGAEALCEALEHEVPNPDLISRAMDSLPDDNDFINVLPKAVLSSLPPATAQLFLDGYGHREIKLDSEREILRLLSDGAEEHRRNRQRLDEMLNDPAGYMEGDRFYALFAGLSSDDRVDVVNKLFTCAQRKHFEALQEQAAAAESPKWYEDAIDFEHYHSFDLARRPGRVFADGAQPDIEVLEGLSADRRVFGGPRSRHHIIVFLDLQCPFCAMLFKDHTLTRLMVDYCKLDVSLAIRHKPEDFHPHAIELACYYEAIFEVDRFKALAFVVSVFSQWFQLRDDRASFFAEFCSAQNLPLSEMNERAQARRIREIVDSDVELSEAMRVDSTPEIFFDGMQISGAFPVNSIIEGSSDRRLLDQISGETEVRLALPALYGATDKENKRHT